ncbi:MAG: hypothetical protein H6719_21410 [Sandaracinaceae bacterium]|nr:hypothetical protein [Sandaracinaceae bacterium]
MRILGLFGGLTLLVACGGDVVMDAGGRDGGADGGSAADAGGTDAGGMDAGGTDAGGADAGGIDAGDTDGGSTDAGSTDAGSMDAGSTDAGSMDAGGTDAGGTDAGLADAMSSADAGNPCETLGGICAGSATDCTSGGGALLPAGDPGCVFVPSPGACCAPPPDVGTGDTCEARGGVCAPLAGCNFVNGAFALTSDRCDDPFYLCCVVGTVCGEEDMHCCDASSGATYRTTCDRGAWTCDHIPGTVLAPRDRCP